MNGSWIVLSLLVSQRVKPPAVNVGWSDIKPRSDRRFRLGIERWNNDAEAHLILTLEEVSGGDKNTTTVDLRRSNPKWDEYKLALPIAVKGEKAPQVLAKLYRPNWLDFEIYAVGERGVTKSFSFSCRDEQAIKWKWSHGRLDSFETFDRFEPPPAGLQRLEKGGYRWQLDTWYRFSRTQCEWVRIKRKWERYKFGAPAGGQSITKPEDCPFLYR